MWWEITVWKLFGFWQPVSLIKLDWSFLEFSLFLFLRLSFMWSRAALKYLCGWADLGLLPLPHKYWDHYYTTTASSRWVFSYQTLKSWIKRPKYKLTLRRHLSHGSFRRWCLLRLPLSLQPTLHCCWVMAELPHVPPRQHRRASQTKEGALVRCCCP